MGSGGYRALFRSPLTHDTLYLLFMLPPSLRGISSKWHMLAPCYYAFVPRLPTQRSQAQDRRVAAQHHRVTVKRCISLTHYFAIMQDKMSSGMFRDDGRSSQLNEPFASVLQSAQMMRSMHDACIYIILFCTHDSSKIQETQVSSMI
jgi:hypothetical protein